MTEKVPNREYNYSDHTGLAATIKVDEPTAGSASSSPTKEIPNPMRGSIRAQPSTKRPPPPASATSGVSKGGDILVELLPMLEQERGKVKKAYFRYHTIFFKKNLMKPSAHVLQSWIIPHGRPRNTLSGGDLCLYIAW